MDIHDVLGMPLPEIELLVSWHPAMACGFLGWFHPVKPGAPLNYS